MKSINAPRLNDVRKSLNIAADVGKMQDHGEYLRLNWDSLIARPQLKAPGSERKITKSNYIRHIAFLAENQPYTTRLHFVQSMSVAATIVEFGRIFATNFAGG